MGDDSQLEPRPPPCSLSVVSLGKVPGAGAAVAGPPGVESGGGDGSVGLRRHPAVSAAPSSRPGSAGGEAASLRTLGVHRWAVLEVLGMAEGSAS